MNEEGTTKLNGPGDVDDRISRGEQGFPVEEESGSTFASVDNFSDEDTLARPSSTIMDEQANEVATKLTNPGVVDDRMNVEQGFQADEAKRSSIEPVDNFPGEDTVPERQTDSPLACENPVAPELSGPLWVTPRQRETYHGVGRALFYGQVTSLGDITDTLQVLQEKVALLDCDQLQALPEKVASLETDDKLQALQGQVESLKMTMQDIVVEEGGSTLSLSGLKNEFSGLKNELTSLTNKVDSIERDPLLPEDSYSFLALSWETRPWYKSRSFLVALSVFAFQVLTLILLAVDIVDKANEENYLNMPGGVNIPVRISQVIALIITVISQDEVRQSLNVRFNGFDEDFITKEFHRVGQPSGFKASRPKWRFSYICRGAEGILALAVTFMLLITVDSVRELLLNFTAVQFVSGVDDAIFWLSRWEYFGRTMKKDADSIKDAKLPKDQKSVGNLRKRYFLIVIGLLMMIPWVFLTIYQLQGEYLPSTIYVQFGDEHSPALGAFSGLYVINLSSRRPRGRADYVFNVAGAYSGSAMFRYCVGDRKWIFLYGESSSESFDVCTRKTKWKIDRKDEVKIRAISSETITYDVSETASETWFYRDARTGRDIPMMHFSARKHDCKQDARSEAGDRFTCIGNSFICAGDWIGVSCQFPSPCMELEVDERHNSFTDSRSWSPMYNISLNDDGSMTQLYGRPVYIGNETQEDYDRRSVYDLLFFVGRRWVLTHSNLIDELKSMSNLNRSEISTFFSDSFHAHWTAFSAVFVSEPVDVDSPADGPTPIDLAWYRSKAQGGGPGRSTSIQKPDSSREEEAVLLCAVCNPESNPCVDENTCSEGECKCSNGSKGRLCQITPEGNGLCNPDFNTAGYGYDGGDCCPRTCETKEFSCGKIGRDSSVFGLNFPQYIGFPDCEDPSQLCEAQELCWKHLVDLKGSKEASQAGRYVTLSGNGAVVAMIELGTELVRVFEQDGFEWKRRGESLDARITGALNTVIESSSLIPSIPSLIALSDVGTTIAYVGNGTVQVYLWDATSESWKSIHDHSVIGEASSIALSGDGTVLATTANYTGSASIFKYISGKGWSQRGLPIDLAHGEFTEPTPRSVYASSLSLSRTGETVAIGRYFNESVGVYAFNSTLNEWISFGPRLRQGGAQMLYSVSLSQDGNALAVGNPTHGVVSVLLYDKTTSSWSRRGMDIRPENETSSSFGWSVSLSDDAATLAVGVPSFKEESIGISHVEVYRYGDSESNSSSWNRYGSDLNVATDDNSGVSVSLSHDGSIVAFGAPTYDRAEAGMVRLMWNTKTKRKARSRSFTQAGVPITFEIQLDSSPWETSLRLVCDGREKEFIPSGVLSQPNLKLLATLSIPNGSKCIFTIEDIRGDGICCSQLRKGFYKIYHGSTTDQTKILAEGGQLFGEREQVEFVAKAPAPSLTPITMAMTLVKRSKVSASLNVTCGNTLQTRAPNGTFQKSKSFREDTFLLPAGSSCSLEIDGISFDDSFDIYLGRDSRDDTNLLLRPGVFDFVVPVCEGCSGTQSVECKSGFAPLQFELTADKYGGGIYYNILSSDGSISDLEGGHVFPNSTLSKQTCVPNEACLVFNLYNATHLERGKDNETCCDGGEASFQILFNNTTVGSGNKVFGYESFSFGVCPPASPSPTISDECPSGKKSLRVELTTDWNPQETRWNVSEFNDGELGTTALLSGGPYRSKYNRTSRIQESMCVPEENCLVFVIEDEGGKNGLCCKFGNGMYKVYYDGVQVATGDEFGSIDISSPFGSCPSLPSASPSVTQAPSFTATPTWEPTPETAAYIEPPTYIAVGCPDGEVHLRFQLTMDRNPQDIYWEAFTVVRDENDAEVAVMEPPAPYDELRDAYQSFIYEECVPNDWCIMFLLSDYFGDGVCCEYGYGSYSLFYDNSLVTSGGGNFAHIEELIGSCDDFSSATPPPTSSPTVGCTGGSVLLRVDLFTDRYPDDTSFVVRDREEGLIWLAAFVDAWTLFIYQECVPDDLCYTFTIYDSYGDGLCCPEGYYSLSFGDDEFTHRGQGNFGTRESVQFGRSCDFTGLVEIEDSESPSTMAPTPKTTELDSSQPSGVEPTANPTLAPAT